MREWVRTIRQSDGATLLLFRGRQHQLATSCLRFQRPTDHFGKKPSDRLRYIRTRRRANSRNSAIPVVGVLRRHRQQPEVSRRNVKGGSNSRLPFHLIAVRAPCQPLTNALGAVRRYVAINAKRAFKNLIRTTPYGFNPGRSVAGDRGRAAAQGLTAVASVYAQATA